jgi:hypothetical protein
MIKSPTATQIKQARSFVHNRDRLKREYNEMQHRVQGNSFTNPFLRAIDKKIEKLSADFYGGIDRINDCCVCRTAIAKGAARLHMPTFLAGVHYGCFETAFPDEVKRMKDAEKTWISA